MVKKGQFAISEKIVIKDRLRSARPVAGRLFHHEEVAGLQFRPAIQPGKLDRSSCSGAVRIVQKRPCRGVVEDAVPIIQSRSSS